jgi:hypothetical protein
MVPTNNRLLALELGRLDKNPRHTLRKGRPRASVILRATSFDNLTDFLESLLCRLYNSVYALENLWTTLEKWKTVVSEFDEVLKICITCSDELETASDVVGDLIVIQNPCYEVVGCFERVRHDGAKDGYSV